MGYNIYSILTVQVPSTRTIFVRTRGPGKLKAKDQGQRLLITNYDANFMSH